MTAADHRIIIEKGSDFKLGFVVKDSDTGVTKDLTGYSVNFRVMYWDGTAIKYVGSDGALVETVNDHTVGCTIETPETDGKGIVKVTSAVTSNIPLKLRKDTKDKFATDYTYFYTVTLIHATKPSMRILRGKCAVRY